MSWLTCALYSSYTGELPGGSTTLFDYYWDGTENKWVQWSQKVPKYVHLPDRKFNKILVPTVDTVRTIWLLDLQVIMIS